MRTRLLGVLVAAAVLASVGSVAGASATPSSEPGRLALDVTGWEHRQAGAPLPDASDGIGPGSYLLIHTNIEDDLGQPNAVFICTANFIWDDQTSDATYLGAAGHCFLPPDDEGARVGDNPYVTGVEVCVSSCAFGGQLGDVFVGELRELGAVVYARQTAGGMDLGNDFGLVTVPDSLNGFVRPSVPVWGGPTGSGTSYDALGVCVYGNGVGLGETFVTKARAGWSNFTDGQHWEALLPSSGGDSGAAVVNCDASSTGLSGTTAVGILTHGLVTGVGPIAFGTTVQRAVQMVQQDWGRTITPRTA